MWAIMLDTLNFKQSQELEIQGSNASEFVINTLSSTTSNRTLYGGDIVAAVSALTKLNQVTNTITESQLNVSLIMIHIIDT